jgi:hypothetical protein
MKPNRGRAGRSISRALQRAAAELTPVVVELGAAVPRLATFVDSVQQGQPGGPLDGHVILAPIAEAGIPVASALAGPVKVRSADPLHPFELQAAHIELCGPGRARVALANALFSATGPPMTTAGRETLVIALAAGTDELDGYTFPVLELEEDGCLIETTVPLEPGRTFVPVELFGESRVVRQAAATVIETVPWLAPDGSRRFRSRLRLEARTFEAGPRCYDVLADPRRVLRILELAALTGVTGWYQAIDWGRDRISLTGCGAGQLTLTLDGTMPERLPLPPRLTLGFELFAISYEMQVRVLKLRGRELMVSLPLVLRRRRRRRDERVTYGEGDRPSVTWRNPFDGSSERAAVVDLSRGGLCIELPAGARLWPGLALEGAVLSRHGSRARIGTAIVRAVELERARAHLEIAGLEGVAEQRVCGWLLESRHPELERHDGADFRTVLDLYRRAGLLSEYMMRNLEALAPTAAAGWRRLHADGSDVAHTFLHRHGDALTGAITSIRAWDHTWFTQHFGVVSTAGGRTSGSLATVNVDHVLSRRDARYMAFFVNAANSAMNSFQQRFLDLTGTAETVGRPTLELWYASEDCRMEEQGVMRPAGRRDRDLISRGAERALGPLAARALSFVPDELSLPATRAGFRRAQLERGRTVEIALDGQGRPAWSLFEERSSPGINLTWMLNAFWLLPIHPDGHGDRVGLRAALARVLAAPSPSPAGDRFLIVDPASVPADGLEAAGLKRLLRAHLFVLTRSAIHRYAHYLADRYGEVGIKSAVREELRARREGG